MNFSKGLHKISAIDLGSLESEWFFTGVYDDLPNIYNAIFAPDFLGSEIQFKQ